MSFFEILAECSIAFAGFGAVHAALKGATSGRGPIRALVIVMLGALAFILSIFPLVLALTALSSTVLWRLVSVVGLPASGGVLVFFFRVDARMTALGQPSPAPRMLRGAMLMVTAATGAMLLNLVGWPWPPGPFLYAFAVGSLLTAGIVALLHSFWVPVESVLRGAPDE